MKIINVFRAVFPGALLGLGVSLQAATHTVQMGNDFFQPSGLSIATGDTITWTNTAGTHTSTDTPLWDSGSMATHATFSHTFPSKGSFSYKCTFHAQFGMLGTITVTQAVAAVTVSVSAPADNAVFSAPASFQLAASASSSGGAITNVQFFAGSTLLGAVTSAPFAINVSGLSNGVYSLTAKATDVTGASATSSPVSITVTTIQLLSLSLLPSGAVQFSITGNVLGKTNLAQASVDFTNWVTLDSTTNAGATITDTAATNFLYRFYRAIELP